ncbi:hypothetical protein 035JT001_31 [Bacillus phage 035JT001]|nr:hypothetical protein 035JT001_31 [Bacillus phage 035JT001]
MKTVYVTLDAEGFVNGWGSTRGQDTDIELILEDDHAFFSDPFSYTIQEGKPVFDQAKKDRMDKEREEFRNRPTVEDRLTENESAHANFMIDMAMKDLRIKEQDEQIERQNQIIESYEQSSAAHEKTTAELLLKLSSGEVL